MPNFTFCRGHEHRTTTFLFFSWTLIQSFRIQLQKNLPTFDELNIRWNKGNKVWGSIHSFFKSCFCNRRHRTLMLKLPSDFFSVWWVLVFCVLFFLGGGGGGVGGGSLLGCTFIPAMGALFNLGAGYQKWNSLWILQAPNLHLAILQLLTAKFLYIGYILLVLRMNEDTHSLYKLLISFWKSATEHKVQ